MGLGRVLLFGLPRSLDVPLDEIDRFLEHGPRSVRGELFLGQLV